MARKKRKTTVYTKQRNRIMSAIRRLKKKGLQTDLYFPTEKELRSQGVKGQELAKLTRELKKISSSQIKETAYVPKQEWTESDFQVPFKQSDDSSFFDRVVITEWYNQSYFLYIKLLYRHYIPCAIQECFLLLLLPVA